MLTGWQLVINIIITMMLIDFVQYGGTDIGGLLEEGEHLPQAGHHGHLGRLVDHLCHHHLAIVIDCDYYHSKDSFMLNFSVFSRIDCT